MTEAQAAPAGTARRGAALPAALLAGALLAGVLPARWLDYRPHLVLVQPWRLFTCHWVHWTADQLAWDLVALLALAWIARRDAARVQGALLAASLAIPAALVLFQPALPSYRGLSGLTSALFTLVGGAMLREAMAASPTLARAPGLAMARLQTGFHGRWGSPGSLTTTPLGAPRRSRLSLSPALRTAMPAVVAVLALVAFAGKLAYELATGDTLFVDSSPAAAVPFVPVPLAHVVGGVCGLLVAFAPAPRWPRRLRALRRALCASTRSARASAWR